jgi:hypothetical protein
LENLNPHHRHLGGKGEERGGFTPGVLPPKNWSGKGGALEVKGLDFFRGRQVRGGGKGGVPRVRGKVANRDIEIDGSNNGNEDGSGWGGKICIYICIYE